MLTLSINSIGVPGWDIHRLIRYAADNRVPCVEIRGLENQLDLLALPCFTSPASVAQIAQALKAGQVKLLSLDLSHRVWDYTPAQDDELRRLADLADRRKQLMQIVKDAEAEKDTIEAKFFHAIGEAKSGIAGGWKINRVERNSTRLDTDRLFAAYPSISKADFQKVSCSSYLTFSKPK